MPASENPIDSAQRVSSIAQIHFSGEDDKVVPPEVAQRFVAAVGGGCAKARLIPVMTHTSDWGKLWPALLAEQPAGQPRP